MRRRSMIFAGYLLVLSPMMLWFGSCAPKQQIVLREVRDVVVDASKDPKLKAQAIFFNPNNLRMKLRSVKVDVLVDGKKRAEIDQTLNMAIPAEAEFTIPLEVTLSMQETGLLDTVLGMLGGKKLNIEYRGSLRMLYHGFPVRVPVRHKDEVRLRF